MKKTLYFCNQCNREIKKKGTRIIPYSFDLMTNELTEEVKVPDNDVHFCMSCTQKIMEEMLGLQKTSIEENAEKISAPKAKNTRPKKEDRLDAGKVMALHWANWSNEKIADEMGVTERQIYQCIRYQKKKLTPDNKPDGKEQEDEKQL